ncbi:hypothetical protein MRX96_019109 [Rhipicephalus microplus]
MSGVASHVLLAQQPALVNRRRRGWVSGPGYFRTASISGTLLPSREPLPRKGVPPASPTDVTRRVAAYYPICSAMQYLALDRETCKEHPAVCTARPLDSSTEARATASRLSRSTEKARAVTGTVRHEQSPLSGPSDLASLVRPLAPRRRQRAPIPRMRRMYRQKSVQSVRPILDTRKKKIAPHANNVAAYMGVHARANKQMTPNGQCHTKKLQDGRARI